MKKTLFFIFLLNILNYSFCNGIKENKKKLQFKSFELLEDLPLINYSSHDTLKNYIDYTNLYYEQDNEHELFCAVGEFVYGFLLYSNFNNNSFNQSEFVKNFNKKMDKMNSEERNRFINQYYNK